MTDNHCAQPIHASSQRSALTLLEVITVVLLGAYVSSYCHFTRPWIKADSGFVLYTSNDDDLTRADLIQHSVLSVCYTPLNWLDHHLLGTPRPPRCILFELS